MHCGADADEGLILGEGLLNDEDDELSGEVVEANIIGDVVDNKEVAYQMGLPLHLLGQAGDELDSRSILLMDADGNATEVPLDSILVSDEHGNGLDGLGEEPNDVAQNPGGREAGEEDGSPALKRMLLEENGRTLIVRLVPDGQFHLEEDSRLCLSEEVTNMGEESQDGEISGDGGMVLEGEGGDEGVVCVTEEEMKVKPSAKGQEVNQNWFTSREDKSTLAMGGHRWKQGMWSREETDLLQANIQGYCLERGIPNPSTVVFGMSKDERKDFYRLVARGLNRPLFSVYRRVIRLYDNKNHLGRYNEKELDKLRQLRAKHGNDWQKISSALGRSASSIRDRCRLLRDNCNQGKWLQEEEDRLSQAVQELSQNLYFGEDGEGPEGGVRVSWAAVARRVASRTEKQCRTKWLNYLAWKKAGGSEWTREDDRKLVTRLMSLEVTDENEIDWAELASGWSAARSPQWLRGKWWSLKRHLYKQNPISNSSDSSSPPSSFDPESPGQVNPPLRELCQQIYHLQPELLGLGPAVQVAPTIVSATTPHSLVVDAGMQTSTFDLQTTTTSTVPINSLGLVTAAPLLIDTSHTVLDDSMVGGGLVLAPNQQMVGMGPGLAGGLNHNSGATFFISCPTSMLPATQGLTLIHTLTDPLSQMNPSMNQVIVSTMSNSDESGDGEVKMVQAGVVDCKDESDSSEVGNNKLSQATEVDEEELGLHRTEFDVGISREEESEEDAEMDPQLMLNDVDPMLMHSSALLPMRDVKSEDEIDVQEEEEVDTEEQEEEGQSEVHDDDDDDGEDEDEVCEIEGEFVDDDYDDEYTCG